MPINQQIWKLTDATVDGAAVGAAVPVPWGRMDTEERLESFLAADIDRLDEGLLLIGRQVISDHGARLDLLAIDAEGRLVIIEIKRNRTPREVVAQLLDYGAWVRGLDFDQIERIHADFVGRVGGPSISLLEALSERFGVEVVPESINASHRMVLVAAELDPSSERIITYLAEAHGVFINAVFFRVFRDGDHAYLTRVWLTEPDRVEKAVERRRERGSWNGETYVSFGGNEKRDWEEARRFGFISAGGSAWYLSTLRSLEPGDRIWVNVPRRGYVGVGVVEEPMCPIDEFMVDPAAATGGRTQDPTAARVPIRSLPLNAARHGFAGGDPSTSEHFVRVRWIATVPIEDAMREKGLFGNQNTVAKPRTPKWAHTVERLKERFRVE